MVKNIRCRIGKHRWRKHHNEQGQPYLTCLRCGKDLDPASQRGWGTGVNP